MYPVLSNAYFLHLLSVGEELGIATSDLLSEAKLGDTVLSNPDSFTSVKAFNKVWRFLERHADSTSFGLVASRTMGPHKLGIAGVLINSSSNLLEVAAITKKYRPLIGLTITPEIVIEGRNVVFRYPPQPPPIGISSAWYDAGILTILTLVRRVAGVDWKPSEIRLRHKGRFDQHYQAFFDCPVHFQCEHTSISFPVDILNCEFPRADPGICTYLRHHADLLLKRASGVSSFSSLVREILPKQLAHGWSSSSGVAKQLGVTERTLQRYLKSEGTSFSQLLENTRKELAEQYLAESERSIAETALLLGYSDVIAFHRAFRRWNGITPGQHRRKMPLQHLSS